MTHFLLLVKNIIDHKDSIYNPQPICEEDVKQQLESCCQDLIKTHVNISQLPNIDINIHDTYAEIIYTSETLTKGWIYNSNVISKQVAVLVQCLPVLNTPPTSNSVACQTEFEDVREYTVTLPVEYPNTDDNFSFESDTVELSCDTHYQSLLPGTPSYTGYANTLLFPTWRDQFTIELKQKLAQPNLGLRPNTP